RKLLTPPALALIVLLFLPGALRVDGSPRLRKVDRSVQQSLDQGASAIRVILQTAPACRAAVRQALQAHGDNILGEHPSVNALTAVVHAADLAEFDGNSCISAVSADA